MYKIMGLVKNVRYCRERKHTMNLLLHAYDFDIISSELNLFKWNWWYSLEHIVDFDDVDVKVNKNEAIRLFSLVLNWNWAFFQNCKNIQVFLCSK